MLTPSLEQIVNAKNWTELYKSLGLNPRNDRACKKVKDYVLENQPDCHLKLRKRYKIDDDSFKRAVLASVSIRDTLKRIGLNAVGAAYLTFHRRVEELGLDTSHFLGQASNKGKSPSNTRCVEEYLKADGPCISSFHLKHKLFKSGLKKKICENCGTFEWLGQPAPLQLDHRDGNSRNNQIDNLRILCAMCHALTPTFAGKNKKMK